METAMKVRRRTLVNKESITIRSKTNRSFKKYRT